MIQILLIVVVAAHLLCVNVACGGPLVASWLDWRGTRGDEAAVKAARYLATWSLAGLGVGALLGAVAGWLKWDDQYRALWLGPLRYKLHWAGIEALFSLVLLCIWWWLLPGNAGGSRRGAATRALVAVLAATNLLYHFPMLFLVAAQLTENGQTQGPPLRGSAFLGQIHGDTALLIVHVVLASLAVAGIVLLILAYRYSSRGEESRARRIARWGGWWGLAPSVLQLPLGLWLLVMLPSDVQSRLMGASSLNLILFVAALAAALWLINELAYIALGEFSRGLLLRAIMAMCVTVALMTAVQLTTRENARNVQVQPILGTRE